MTELPPEAAALLEKARREHNPTELESERVRRALHARLGIAAALTPTAASAVLSSKAAAASLGAQTSAALSGGQSGGFGAAGALSAAAASKTGTLLFGLKASKVILAMVTLSGAAGVASMPLMRSDPRPRASATQCTSEPCSGLDAEATALTREGLAPSVTPTPTAESLAQRRAESERHVRRHDRPDARRARTPHGERAREVAASRDEKDDHDAPTPGDRVHGAPEPTISSRASAVSGATETVNGAVDSPSRDHAAGVNAAPERASDATAPATPTVDAPAAPRPELALIRSALTSLRDGAPQRALALLSEHGEAYPEGAFASERRGLRIVALCASGRLDEGRKERVVFLRREGAAPVAERVRRACQEAPGK